MIDKHNACTSKLIMGTIMSIAIESSSTQLYPPVPSFADVGLPSDINLNSCNFSLVAWYTVLKA